MAKEDFTKEMKTERLTAMANAFKNAGTLLAAIEAGVFTAISEGARDLNGIAGKTDLPEETVDRLLTVCKALDLVFRHVEIGVDHPQRLEDPLFQKMVKRRSRHHLHQITEHVRSQAVAPGAARLVRQGQPDKLLNHLFERGVRFLLQHAPDVFLNHLIYRVVFLEPIAETRCMCQQMPYRDLTLQVCQLEP